MRFWFALMAIILSVGAFAERVNPKVEAIIAEANERTSEEALARYSQPGEASRYESLLRAMKQSPESIGSPSEDVYTPVQVHDNGETKVALQAGQGWMTDDLMMLRGKDVQIFAYREDGSLESTIYATEIMIDRHSMLAVMRGPVSVNMGIDTMQGNGALLDLNLPYIRLLRKAKVSTSRLADVNIDDSTL